MGGFLYSCVEYMWNWNKRDGPPKKIQAHFIKIKLNVSELESITIYLPLLQCTTNEINNQYSEDDGEGYT